MPGLAADRPADCTPKGGLCWTPAGRICGDCVFTFNLKVYPLEPKGPTLIERAIKKELAEMVSLTIELWFRADRADDFPILPNGIGIGRGLLKYEVVADLTDVVRISHRDMDVTRLLLVARHSNVQSVQSHCHLAC